MNNEFLGGFDAPTAEELVRAQSHRPSMRLNFIKNAIAFPPSSDLRVRREGSQAPNNLEPHPTSSNSTTSMDALDGHTAALDFAPVANVTYALSSTFEAALEAMPPNTPITPETNLFDTSVPMSADWSASQADYAVRTPRTPLVAKMNLYLFISPYTFIRTAPLTFVTYFAEDFCNPSIALVVEAGRMPWNKLCYVTTSSMRKVLEGTEALMLDGALQGRWTVEEMVYATKKHAFIRIKNRRRRLLAVMAFPRRQVTMPEPSESVCLCYETILKDPTSNASTQDVTEPILEGEENYLGERFVALT
ncbi:hypothetical protein C8R47DRAFT_1083543 [Mycena vitilis]|nr:hypothetical protein C8R47DRAFT_1083543 [Mycena vitilis]